MKKSILLSALAFSFLATTGCASTQADGRRHESAGELLDDATTTTAVRGLIIGDRDAHLFKIEVTTTRGDVRLQGFVNSRETEDRLLGKIRELRGVRTVKSVLLVELGKGS
jgi:osmotically-inducible protein OsmY